MGRTRTLPAERKVYTARHRTLKLMPSTAADVAEARAIDTLITRYSYRYGKRWSTGPRGGKVLRKFWRDTYVTRGGVLVEIRRTRTEAGEPVAVAVPCRNVTAYNAKYTAGRDGKRYADVIETDDAGRVCVVTFEDGTTWTRAADPDAWPYVRALLGWDHKKRRSPRKPAEAPAAA